ncbi:LLM class flavin-dependent oxidoreductase [Egibacter rhizosphaerae]|uniref:LLM class flavin-dependent oxidoreductase n=1 Tax=Egibacter rhizosphaerae TaxID=1670831 RepID=A0A411YGV2_9ACTN|nr:LLM class flavin-dependent oxidoreductase [Egibacter rhizosphaerae]QBI20386.1 LLM class flavin-dependent oxidoreductase [Egibacter rhizosphaerae]
MKFSLYSELQHWPGKTWRRQVDETLEQIAHADTLGYDAYAVVEHYFFPKFSMSTNPFALFGAAAQRTQRINFRTLLHPLPFYNPVALASQIAFADLVLDGRYEFGVGRGHGWMPPKAGLPMDEESVPRYQESLELFAKALEEPRFSFHGEYYQIEDAQVVPPPERKFRVFLGGTSDHTYEMAARHGWAVVVPPLLPYAALRDQLDLYREKCAVYGNEPDIVWIHACYIDEDRDKAHAEAREAMRGFLAGNASPLTEYERPDDETLMKASYGFYASGILEGLAETPYEKMIEDDIVWVGTPDDVGERIQAVRDVCEGLTEVAITVNPGGIEHWQALKAQELFARTVMPHFRQG